MLPVTTLKVFFKTTKALKSLYKTVKYLLVAFGTIAVLQNLQRCVSVLNTRVEYSKLKVFAPATVQM